ncbi:hypothetical protein ACLF3G_27255 [Falsiroseomonas sp. HC035]|uniref:hypothetical protein n=1 Tax=Falsiroseomonas sp. HC035 TaxID=3390999 RepID=UPI003D31C736
MRRITLDELSAQVDAAIERAGIVYTPEYVDRLRNKGQFRTAEKRELLRAIEERARAAGLEPIKAYY